MPSEPKTSAPKGRVPLFAPHLGGNEWAYLKECLETNWVSSAGPFVDRFEEMAASYLGAGHGVAVVNGTAALHIALRLAGVGDGDEVILPALTFIAPANAVRYLGAWPVFLDIEPDHLQMDPQRVIDFLSQDCRVKDGAVYNKATGRRVRAILPVHLLGHPVDLDPIGQAAEEYGLALVEDATEALGARYKGRLVGADSRLACFSFNGNKIITTGGGGMIVTDDEELAGRARYLATQAKDDTVEYVHNEVGYNYRLTNIQAALGCAQMEQLDEFIAAKIRLARTYDQALAGRPGLVMLQEADWAESIFWLCTIIINEADYGLDARSLRDRLHRAGIQSRTLWQPLHLSPAHRGASAPGGCPAAEAAHQKALTLPSSVGLSLEDQGRVIEAVKG